jgi:hypothetical protein
MPGLLEQVLRTVASCTSIVALAAAAACSGSETGPSLPNIGGSWQLSAGVENDSAVTCVIGGALAISQSGDHFTGQVSGSTMYCLTSTPGDSTNEGNVDGSITGGTIKYNLSMSFSDGGCFYKDGLIVDIPNQQVTGRVICNFSYKGQSYPFSGSWGLAR